MTDKPDETDLLEDFLNKSFKIKDKELKINGIPKKNTEIDEYFNSLLEFKTREAHSIKKFVATEFMGTADDYYNFIIDNDNPIINCDYDMINKLMFFLRLKKYRSVLKLLTIYLEILSLRLQKILKVEEEEEAKLEAETPDVESETETPDVESETETPAVEAGTEAPTVETERELKGGAEPETPESVDPDEPEETTDVTEPEAPTDVEDQEDTEIDKTSEELEVEIKELESKYNDLEKKLKLDIKVPVFADHIKMLEEKLMFFKEVMENPEVMEDPTKKDIFSELYKDGFKKYYEDNNKSEAIFRKIFNNKPIRSFETHSNLANTENILTEIIQRKSTGLETNVVRVKYQSQVDYKEKKLYSNEVIFKNILDFDYTPPPPESCNDITKLFNEGIKKILSDINRYFNHIYFYINLSSILMSKVDLHTKKLSTYSDNLLLINKCVETFETLSCYEDIKSKETLEKIKNKENVYTPDYEELIIDFEKFKNLNRELNNIFKIL